MSDLTNIEKRRFEKLFDMESGYVMSFSNRSFDDFVIDSTGLSILDEKYNQGSGSKANRLRAFWTKEPNHVVAKLLQDLMQSMSLEQLDNETKLIYEECGKAVARLVGNAATADFADLKPNSAEREFSILAREVRESIGRNEPEVGLDRLHTFTVCTVIVIP